TYAEEQANAERVKAEAYADGIVTAEEEARIADVNAKLELAKADAKEKADAAELAASNLAREADRLAKAAQETADDAIEEIQDAAKDNKLTAVEKKQVQVILDEIKREHSNIIYRTEKYNIDTTDYDAAYKNLSDYINPLLLDKTVTSDIDRVTFN